MECIYCYNQVAAARVEAGYNYCILCAKNVPKVMGVMQYGHKTAGEIQVVTPDQFKEHRRYNPYGRNTGRGSGVHRVMQRSNV